MNEKNKAQLIIETIEDEQTRNLALECYEAGVLAERSAILDMLWLEVANAQNGLANGVWSFLEAVKDRAKL